VLNQLIDTVLGKDKEFVQWRAEHAHSHMPHGTNRVRRSRGPSAHRPSTVPVSAAVPLESTRVS
jgi:hypothetical protein